MFALSDYHYHLDEDLIAQEAIKPHHDAKLMIINKDDGTIDAETTFWQLDNYLEENTVLFFNDSNENYSMIKEEFITHKVSI